MLNRLEQIERILQRVKALVPEGEDVQDYLARGLETQLSSASPDTPMGIVPISILSRATLYSSARIAVEYIDQPERLAAKPEGIVDLGVIEWLLRPALPLNDGLFDEPTSGPWRNIAANVVKQQSHAVCRLDLGMEGYADSVHVGTGFVVGRDSRGLEIIMTNAHVVEGALAKGWTLTPGLIFGCDFACHQNSTSRQLIPALGEYKLHPNYDLAILYLERPENNGLERPLEISQEAPLPVVGSKIGVIGHPSFDSRLDPFPRYFGFGNEFGIKRFSPGEIRGLERRNWRNNDADIFLHDASTLSGSSGSCILDLNSGKVIGLHFGGWPMQQRLVRTSGSENIQAQLFFDNGAIPLWALRDDPLVREATVH